MTAALTSVGVQQVSITIANGATTGTATITAVGTGAFITWQGQTTTDSTTTVSSHARVELTNSTTVTATRNTASTDTITINAVIADCDTTNFVKTVQSGTTTILTAATSGTSTITAVTNTNTAIFYLGQSSASAAASFNRSLCNASLSGTTVTVARAVSNQADIVGWCVVEFQGTALNSSTQNLSVASPASGVTKSTTITGVTTANTMIAYGGTLAQQAGSPAKDFVTAQLTSTTNIDVTYNTAPLVTTDTTKLVVIEFVSGVLAQNIQRGTISISAATSNTTTITSSATASTLVNFLGYTSTETTASPNKDFYKLTQTNATTLTLSVNTSATGVGAYEVVQLNAASTTPVIGTGLHSIDGGFVRDYGGVPTIDPGMHKIDDGITLEYDMRIAA